LASEERIEMSEQLARRVIETLMAREGTAPCWALQFQDASPGFARVTMALRADMLNGHETAHGGMIFALADSAFAYACNSRNEAAVAYQASIIFLSPAHAGETLVAEARECALVGRSGTYTVDIRTADGRPIAHFQGLSRLTGEKIITDSED
jgi:acyl-CoA thioesterase